MLIAHPSIMIRQARFVTKMEAACCWFATMFPKLFCVGILTWGLWVLVVIIGPDMVLAAGVLTTSLVIGLGLILYVLAMYSYFKVIQVGPGSPLDYEELKIRNIESLNPRNRRKMSSTETLNSSNSNSTRLNSDDDDELDDPRTPFLAHTDDVSDVPETPPTEYMVIHTRSAQGYRFCTKCLVWKPDRTHHCSSSGKCILRMDHYCPWFSTCIGHFNHKFFLQFLAYISMFSGVLFASSLALLWQFLSGEVYKTGQYLSINLVALFVLSFALGGSTGVFAGFLIYLVLKNLTTIELYDTKWNLEPKTFQYEFSQKKKIGHIFDLGYKKNWTSVMGNNWVQWLLPILVTTHSITGKNNGVNFDINTEAYAQWQEQDQLQSQLNQQLREYNQQRNNS